MPNFRRAFVPGGTYYFTLVTAGRAAILDHPPARSALGAAIRRCRDRWPFQVDAIVLLPDHLHTIWSLPRGDVAYPTRWAWIKREFTRAWLAEGGSERMTTASQHRGRRRGVWQRRFWEHLVRDEDEMDRIADYIHYNPVKHGHVPCPADWPYSSFARRVEQGTYPPDWGCRQVRPIEIRRYRPHSDGMTQANSVRRVPQWRNPAEIPSRRVRYCGPYSSTTPMK